MIIYEWLIKVFKEVITIMAWLITGRDCYHCENGYIHLAGHCSCTKGDDFMKECWKGMFPKNFERKKKK